MVIHQARTEHLKEELLTKMDNHHERMMARIDSQLEKNGGLRKMGAMDLKANPEEK
jgi:hypothetical protein